MTLATTKHLDSDQRATYHDQGWLVLRGVIAPERIAALREALASPPEDAYAYRSHALALTLRHPRFAELAGDPALVGPVTDLLGPDVQLQHSKAAIKDPGGFTGPFPWHQDFAYFPHSNTDLAAVMVALDDCDETNGCLHVVSGSHRGGLRDHLRDGVFQGACRDEPDPAQTVPLRLAAGDVSIHHCLTLHGSPPNRSERPRRCLVFQYRADDAYQFADHVFPDTGRQVAGRHRGRVRCEHACWQLPRRADGSYGAAWNQRGAHA